MTGALRVAGLMVVCAVLALQTAGAVTITVTNTNDSGPGSFRQAIIDTNAFPGADIINFGAGVSGTIGLISLVPFISGELQIIGPGADILTIRRVSLDFFGILNSPAAGSFAVSGLSFENGSNSGTGSGRGGAIRRNGGVTTITDCIFEDNHADYGGGLYIESSQATVTNCAFMNNTSGGGGGGIEVFGSVTISDCTFSGNVGNGGGMNLTTGGSVRVTNCTITGNYAVVGNNSTGGVHCILGSGADCLFTNCTICRNSTLDATNPYYGGIRASNFALAKLLNCIVAENTYGTARSDISGTFVSMGNNIIGDTTGGVIAPAAGDQFGTGAAPINPMLGPLADNGGDTMTHALLLGSPAINTGTATGAPALDQRGQARVGATDIGAFEFVPVEPEMDVSRNAAPVADGSTDNATGAMAGVPLALTYTIANGGTAALTITPVAAPGGLSNCTAAVTTQPLANVPGPGTTTLVVTVTPTNTGAFSCTVSITNNDADENPYNWTISGNAAASVPEIAVSRGATPIADGGTDALGIVAVGVAQSLAYTVANSGSASLSLPGTPDAVVVTAGTNIAAVSVTIQPPTSVAGLGSANFTISFTVQAVGAFDFSVSIENDDADEDPYNWTVSGTGSNNVPEMDVSRDGTPVLADVFDAVGNSRTGDARAITYTITNNGGADLTLGGAPAVQVSSAVNCIVVVSIQPVTTLLAASASTTFEIQVTPLADGAFTCLVSIDNDDPNESPYTFNVLGAGVAPSDGGGEDEGCAASAGAGSMLPAGLAALALAAAPWRRRRTELKA